MLKLSLVSGDPHLLFEQVSQWWYYISARPPPPKRNKLLRITLRMGRLKVWIIWELLRSAILGIVTSYLTWCSPGRWGWSSRTLARGWGWRSGVLVRVQDGGQETDGLFGFFNLGGGKAWSHSVCYFFSHVVKVKGCKQGMVVARVDNHASISYITPPLNRFVSNLTRTIENRSCDRYDIHVCIYAISSDRSMLHNHTPKSIWRLKMDLGISAYF